MSKSPHLSKNKSPQTAKSGVKDIFRIGDDELLIPDKHSKVGPSSPGAVCIREPS